LNWLPGIRTAQAVACAALLLLALVAYSNFFDAGLDESPRQARKRAVTEYGCQP